MNDLTLPELIKGQWIARVGKSNTANSYTLFSYDFTSDHELLNPVFRIAARGFYQLFINGRLMGGGPRRHPLPGNHYADAYDCSHALRVGENTVAVVLRAPESTEYFGALWCQLNDRSSVICHTNERWQTRIIGCARSAIWSGIEGSTRIVATTGGQDEWMFPEWEATGDWLEANYSCETFEAGWHLHAARVGVPELCDEMLVPYPMARGNFTDNTKLATGFTYPAESDQSWGNWRAAGRSYVFLEDAQRVKFIFFSDSPCVLIINNEQVFTGECADGVEFDIDWRCGWNRLVIITEPEACSTGVLLVFPELEPGAWSFYQDMLEDSHEGWLVKDKLYMPLELATGSMHFASVHGVPVNILAQDSLSSGYFSLVMTKSTPLTESGNGVMYLEAGEYRVFRWDRLRYGYVMVHFEASEGDLVEVMLGNRLDDQGLPVVLERRRIAYALHCSEGNNELLTFAPLECAYVAVIVRKATKQVVLKQIYMEELSRSVTAETTFRCSDQELNQVWRCSINTLMRGTAKIDTSLLKEEVPALFERCALALNQIMVYGDREFAVATLKEAFDGQLENGDIPRPLHDGHWSGQLEQLYLLPVWLIYYYRATGDLHLLRDLQGQLALLMEFLDGFVNEDSYLVENTGAFLSDRGWLGVRRSDGDGCSTLLNVLYCRCILSVGEVYRLLGRKDVSTHYLREAVLLAERLRVVATDPEHGGLLHRHISNGVYGGAIDLETNVMALLAGVLEPDKFELVFKRFFKEEAPFVKAGFHVADDGLLALLLEMMFAYGKSEWALKYLKYYFHNKCDLDVEGWRIHSGRKPLAPARHNGGGAILPNWFLLREIAGVRSAIPGFVSVFFNPPCEMFKYAEVDLPVAGGNYLHLTWNWDEAKLLHVYITSPIAVKIIPECDDEILEKTVFHIDGLVEVAGEENFSE